MDYVDPTGAVHELPKMTRAFARKVEAAKAEPDQEKKWKAQLGIVKECLGDSMGAVIGGETLDTCDVYLLESAFEDVLAAYEAPKREAQAARLEETLSSIDVDKLQRMADMLDSLSRVDSRQGFKNVK